MINDCGRQCGNGGSATDYQYVVSHRQVVEVPDADDKLAIVGQIHIVNTQSNAYFGKSAITRLERPHRVDNDSWVEGAQLGGPQRRGVGDERMNTSARGEGLIGHSPAGCD